MLFAFLFAMLCFFLTCLGGSIVFFVKKNNEKINAFLHSFASGVMIASGIFSLIIPAISYCNDLNVLDYIILPVCFIFAGMVIYVLECFSKKTSEQNINTETVLIGIMLHNIPEGMCVGFAFSTAVVLGTGAAFASAVMIAIGIGIQNIPEGSAVSFPLYSVGKSKAKAFFSSVKVASVEVPSAIVAYLVGTNLTILLPFMLAFSGAIMIAVPCLDLMPEAVKISKKMSIVCFFAGFIIMMLLDLALS